MFGRYTYLVDVLMFCLIPIGLMWVINFQFLRRNIRVIGIASLAMFIYLCATNPFAEVWHNWFFSADRNLGLQVINFPVEEALFFLLVPIAIATATLCFIYWLDRRSP